MLLDIAKNRSAFFNQAFVNLVFENMNQIRFEIGHVCL